MSEADDFSTGEEVTVTAAEMVRQFAHFREEANKQPIFITAHGRKTHVMCSAERWKLMENLALGYATSERAERTTSIFMRLIESSDDGFVVCDKDLCVLLMNHSAEGMTGTVNVDVEYVPLLVRLPQIRGTLMETHIRKTLKTGEPTIAEVPSPFREDNWLRIHCMQVLDRIILRMRDVSDQINQRRLSERKRSIKNCIEAHESIAYMRLTMRGTIEEVSERFADALGLPSERLQGVGLADLAVTSDKPKLRELLESVLRGKGTRCASFDFLKNSGGVAAMTVSAALLNGPFGAEGAAIMLTL